MVYKNVNKPKQTPFKKMNSASSSLACKLTGFNIPSLGLMAFIFFFLSFFRSLVKQQGRPDSPVYTNLQELKISQSSTPPLPSSSPLHSNGDWETHKDQNGRYFYYNRSTQDRTWKPPRVRDSLTRKEEKQETTEAEVHTQNIFNAHKTHT